MLTSKIQKQFANEKVRFRFLFNAAVSLTSSVIPLEPSSRFAGSETGMTITQKHHSTGLNDWFHISQSYY